ncbi:MAG TPA: Crp/Fnr family transcriptional regulator [Rhizomicrobium sp.]|nr:Crp/Fnr family transcriptional regulator [Rhizomicrobium sp.]
MKRPLPDILQDVFVCSAEVAAGIGRFAAERRFPVRTVIVKQGDHAGATYLMIAGRAHALTYGFEGQLVLLHEFLTGDFFGAVAQTGSEPEDADVVAVEITHAAIFQAPDFLALIETYGCVGLAVSRALLRQLRAAASKVVQRTTLSAAGRVHAELLRLANQGDGRTLRPAPVLSKLALRVQSTRETVSRTISALERRGIIRREGNALVIVAPHRLEELVV